MATITNTPDPRVYYKVAEKYLLLVKPLTRKLASHEANYVALTATLAALRGVYIVHQSHHWQVQGSEFFADHLLYQRLYEETLPEIDSLAEKLVGVDGPWGTNLFLQHKMTEEFMKLTITSSPSTPLHVNGMQTELVFLALVNLCTAVLKDENLLSFGLEQTLGELARKHEEHTYLLQQRIG
jgi:DNA-binding ferritin-like protein